MHGHPDSQVGTRDASAEPWCPMVPEQDRLRCSGAGAWALAGVLVSFDHDDAELGNILEGREPNSFMPWAVVPGAFSCPHPCGAGWHGTDGTRSPAGTSLACVE